MFCFDEQIFFIFYLFIILYFWQFCFCIIWDQWYTIIKIYLTIIMLQIPVQTNPQIMMNCSLKAPMHSESTWFTKKRKRHSYFQPFPSLIQWPLLSLVEEWSSDVCWSVKASIGVKELVKTVHSATCLLTASPSICHLPEMYLCPC